MPSPSHQPSVFISYRRDDSAGWAGRLEDDLAELVGARHVFRDVEIPAGVDYQQHIESVLDICQVVVVVIGPNWLSSTAADGTPRLAQPDDLLRREVERALLRDDVHVVPALVQGAAMPAAHELPGELQALARRQAFELSDARWRHDVLRLVGQVGAAVEADLALADAQATGDERGLQAAAGPRAEAMSRARRDRLTAVVTMIAAAALGALLAAAIIGPASIVAADARLNRAAEAAIAWAIIGALVFGAAAATLPDVRANPIGWGILGVFNGAVAGALSAAAFIALEDDATSGSPLLGAVATGVAGVALGLALAKRVQAERWRFALAGLIGGLLGGTLAGSEAFGGPDREVGPALLAIVATVAGLALVAAGGLSAFGGLKRGLPRS